MKGDTIVEGFRGVSTASVSDAVDKVCGRRGFMSPDIRPILPGRMVGPAVTVLEGPGLMAKPPLHALEAIDEADPGTIVVIGIEDPVAGREVAVWGGLMTTAAIERRLEGAVLDAGLRDLEEIREAGFQVFSRSIIPATTVGRYVTLARDVPVVCGGVWVRPGDVIVGDTDGVVVVPRSDAAEVLSTAQEMEEAEQHMAEAIKRTGSILEALRELGRI
jgi:4-hydroxy-4-methyl-2-oxoglutarate aldolase